MTRRVLIIDDSLTVRMDLSELFAEQGYEVTACETLAGARAAVASQSPHVIVLDLQLPDGDGLEFLREVRSSPQLANIGVILLSAQSDVEDRLRGLAIGADEYIGKPYDTELLLSRASDLATRGGAATILVIDDSLTYRERLRELVESAGYAAVTAESGEEGLRLAMSLRPTAMIVDYMLPGIQGDAVIRRIRQQGKLKRTPTLLLTASEDPRDQLKALEAGADTFVRKDQDPGILLACLNSIIRGASTPSAVEDEQSSDGQRVLIVGDAMVAAQIQAEFHHDAFAGVSVLSDASRKLPALDLVDCVVLDARNHDAHRIESEIQAVKAHQEHGDVRIIVIGDVDEAKAMLSFMNAGADDFVVGNSGAMVIAARVRAHLRRKRVEDENRNVREQLLRNRLIAETQKELARAAAIRNEELQQLAESLPALVWTTDPEGKLTYCNTRWLQYTGIANTAAGTLWLDAIHPEDRQSAEDALRSSMRSAKPFQVEFRMRSAAATYRWFICRALPVRAEGVITRWIGTAIDVEERHQAEEALRRSEKIAATGRMAAAIAHEINNPLAAVVNVLYLLPKAINDDTPLAMQYVEIAQQELSRISHITRQTLAFYRDSGEAAEIDLCPLIDEVMNVYAAKALEGGVKLETQLDCRGRIVGFTGEVRQVISNLVANAIEASASGGRVTVRVKPSRNLRTGAEGVRIGVHDRGHGIPKNFAPELFKAFSTTKGQKGTGLGLWVTQSIVEKHGGDIRVRSSVEPGRSGTTVTVFFPSAADAKQTNDHEIHEVFGDVGRELLDGERN